MFLALLKTVGAPLVELVVDSVTGWVARKKIRTQHKIDVEGRKATADIDWDAAQVDASKHSWKDEFWTIVLAVPIILAFVPQASSFVEEGFIVLRDSTPDWYKAAVGVAISAAFGARQFSKIMSRRAAHEVSKTKIKVEGMPWRKTEDKE